MLLQNVSHKAYLERLKDLSEYKDKLLATVSHDLRTPINGVIGQLEEQIEVPTKEGFGKLKENVLGCLNLLLFMVNDILDLYQIKKGKLRLNFD